MKCPHCGEELGLNNICINPSCSYFSTSFSDNDAVEEIQQDLNIDKKDTPDTDTSNYNDDTSSNTKSTFKFTANPNNICDEEFQAFFGPKNINYYLNNLKQYKISKKFTSWNWPCFFLGPYWLLYRKMFALAFGYMILNLILTFLTEMPFSLLLRIVTAVFANGLYIHHCESKIRKIKISHRGPDLTSYFSTLRKKGGTSIVAPILLLILTLVIGVLITAGIFALLFVPYYDPQISFPNSSYF